MANLDQLGEAPETSAQHLQNGADLATELEAMAQAVEQYHQNCVDMGMDPASVESWNRLAEHLHEAAQAASDLNSDFEEHYGGVLEHVDGGKTVFTENGKSEFWAGQ